MLIDDGATHNFIDEGYVAKKNLSVVDFEGFRVVNANGQLSLCDKMVKQLGIRVQDHIVRDDFYVFPMGGLPYMVLGVQWLYSLGDFRWFVVPPLHQI